MTAQTHGCDCQRPQRGFCPLTIAADRYNQIDGYNPTGSRSVFAANIARPEYRLPH